MIFDRRIALKASAAALAGCFTPAPAAGRLAARLSDNSLPPLFADIEERTFRFFWERTNPVNGLVPDRWPTPSFSSIAAIGCALSLYPLGVERGWIDRRAAAHRTRTTLHFLSNLPMGDAPQGVAGHRGFFYHFLDMETGHRYRQTELSTVDSSFLFMGALFAAGWFDGDSDDERDIRRLAIDLVDRAEWDWFQQGGPAISMGWHPESGFIERNWDGYNEGMMVYILALGSGRHAARNDSWSAWTAPYDRVWRGDGPTRRLAFAPLLGHQYSHMWIDFRGIFDAPMREAGFDYFENSRRAVYSNRGWCMANPMGWDGYGPDIWGLTACDGPGNHRVIRGGREVQFHSYAARGPMNEPDGSEFGRDDGTLAPTAVISSLPFAPELCIPATAAMHSIHGRRIYGRYGFIDAYNPSFRDPGLAVETGHVDPVHGWVGGDYLGIDQGSLLMMIANYRNDAIWRVMRRSPHILRGLRRAGFSGGWME